MFIKSNVRTMAIKFLFVNFVIRARNNIFRSFNNTSLNFHYNVLQNYHTQLMHKIYRYSRPTIMFDFCSLVYNNLFGINTQLYPASRKHEILGLCREYDYLRRCSSFCAIGLLGNRDSMHKQSIRESKSKLTAEI